MLPTKEALLKRRYLHPLLTFSPVYRTPKNRPIHQTTVQSETLVECAQANAFRSIVLLSLFFHVLAR